MKIEYTLILLTFIIVIFAIYPAVGQAGKRDLYELRTYHIENTQQEALIDAYLKNAFIPAAHRNGIKEVGVFKPIASEPDAGKKIYVFIPYSNSKSYFTFPGKLDKDNAYQQAGKEYIYAAHNNPPYKRIETALMQGFTGSPRYSSSGVTGPKKDRIYELRSYEAATERLYQQKVKMFNNGEIDIFDKLNFNPIFYGETLAGAQMPNLMYLTTFENMDKRNAGWNAFRVDPDWEAMKDLEEYRNTVSKNDTRLLYPAEYSDL
jgi:hypothetical protein